MMTTSQAMACLFRTSDLGSAVLAERMELIESGSVGAEGVAAGADGGGAAAGGGGAWGATMRIASFLCAGGMLGLG